MLKIIVLIFCACAFPAQDVHSARILGIIVNPSYSHQVFFQPLWRELALRGHDVVVITSDPTNERLPHFREISTHASYPKFKESLDMMINATLLDFLFKTNWAEKALDMMNQTIGLPEVRDLIRNKSEHFDLLMIEHMMSPFFGLQKVYDCPLIGVASMDALPTSHNLMGNAVHSVLYPFGIVPRIDNLSFLERIMAIGLGNLFDLIMYYPALIEAMDKIAKDSFDLRAEDILEGFDSTDMLFVNANPIFTSIRPLTPSTISVAGLHMKPPQPLPHELKTFLDASKEGVIYFSLGGNVKSNELSLHIRQVIVETMSKLPYKVLYKYEDDILPGRPANVKLIKWAPQQDLLRHKHIKLFITQGGIQSLEEALYSHVPMVVIPFFGDQLPNAEKLQQKGLGIALDRHNLTVDAFESAIIEVITNPSYRNAVKYYAQQIQDAPMKPLERAVWWTEYVLRHKGAKHLRGPRLPFYQYYYVDILAALGLVLLILLGVMLFIGKCLVRTVTKLCGLPKSTIAVKPIKKTN